MTVAEVLDPCRVHGPGGELVAEGFVRETDGRTVLVEAPRSSGRWVSPGDAVRLVVLNAALGKCTYDGTVRTVGPERVEVADLVLRERVQKRSAARVPTSLPVRLTRTAAGEVTGGLDAPGGQPVEALEAVVLDVGAHGLRFRCDAELAIGTVLGLTFTATRRPLDLAVEVLGGEPLRGGHAYRARLVEPAERTTDELFRFVLEEQRRRRAERHDRL